MAERRSLTEGLKPPPAAPTPPPLDPQVERRFVHGAAAKQNAAATTSPFARAPISTRIRADFAEALKRASLERQLNKIEPNTLQDILEEAIEPWLKANGYLT